MAKRLQEARPVKSCGRRLQADAIKYEEAAPMVNFRRKNIQLLGLFETKPVAGRLTTPIYNLARLTELEKTNVPDYRCCCLRLNRHNFSTRVDTRAASSARGCDHASPLSVRSG